MSARPVAGRQTAAGADIPFSRPTLVGAERDYVRRVFEAGRFSGSREFGRRCGAWLAERFDRPGALLTSSGTHALELAALLLSLRAGDEVITASFGFPSTANAFALRGARLVFVDVRPDTMNLDEALLEDAITPRTRALALTHYAGVSCEMDAIGEIARRRGLAVVEDAAHAIGSRYRGRDCGSFGRFACLSFHESKNVQCGEGGALLLGEAADVPRAEIAIEKGTDRSRFFRGEVDRYSWVDLGSSWLPPELSAAFLLAQLERLDAINADRLRMWSFYREQLQPLERAGRITLPHVPAHCEHNAHCFWLKAADRRERDALLEHLAASGIRAVFHYVPLHSSRAGLRYGRFHGEDRFTTRGSEQLARLPLYHSMPREDAARVVEAVFAFYDGAG